MQLKEREKNLKTSRALPTHVCLQNCPGFPRCHRVVTLFTAPATRVSHCSHTFQATSVKLFQLSRRRKVSQQGTPINFPLATRSNYPSRPCVRLVSVSGQMVKTSFCIFLYRLMQLTVNNSKYWQSHCCCQLQSPACQLFLLGRQIYEILESNCSRWILSFVWKLSQTADSQTGSFSHINQSKISRAALGEL